YSNTTASHPVTHRSSTTGPVSTLRSEFRRPGRPPGRAGPCAGTHGAAFALGGPTRAQLGRGGVPARDDRRPRTVCLASGLGPTPIDPASAGRAPSRRIGLVRQPPGGESLPA